jgi:hypothetical protein
MSMLAQDGRHIAGEVTGLATAARAVDNALSGGECARVAALALALLADSRAWLARQSPEFRHVPVEAMAFSGAAVSPWRRPAEVAPCMRMYLWIFAFDDVVESFTPGDEVVLDDLMARCANVVRGGHDDSHWLLTALSDWQRDLESRPLYPALSGLWTEKFDAMLRSMRWEWSAGHSGPHDNTGLPEYLANADSIAAWVTVLPRWITYGGDGVLDHLDTLVSALAEYVVADRLANDLASIGRERDLLANDNVLRYGVSSEWVAGEIARRVNVVHRLLDELAAEAVLPAVELLRETDYATTFYGVAEFRGWGSDAGD